MPARSDSPCVSWGRSRVVPGHQKLGSKRIPHKSETRNSNQRGSIKVNGTVQGENAQLEKGQFNSERRRGRDEETKEG